jgi:hypothetical protein
VCSSAPLREPFQCLMSSALLVSDTHTHGGSNTCDVPLQMLPLSPHSVNKHSMIA